MLPTPAANFSRRQWLVAASAGYAGCVLPQAVEGARRTAWPRQRPTPTFQLPKLEEGTWNLASAKGQPVLLNFWATWCEPCRTEMPSLEQLAARHQGQGLQVMAVNFREGEAPVRRFIAATGLRLPVLYDRDGAAAKAFGVTIFPGTVAIDRRGRASFVVVGGFDWTGALAQEWLAPLLA
jgi:peroxiredoxin